MIQPACSGVSGKISAFFCVLLLFFCPVIFFAKMQPKIIPVSPLGFQETHYPAILEKPYPRPEFKYHVLSLNVAAGISTEDGKTISLLIGVGYRVR